MITHVPPPHLRSLFSMKAQAEDVADGAKHVADALRVEYARHLLCGAFPSHSVAVFRRYWDQEEPQFLQILSDHNDVADVDIENISALTSAQQKTVSYAESQIACIGSDADVLDHLDRGEDEHGDWFEFRLSFRDAAE